MYKRTSPQRLMSHLSFLSLSPSLSLPPSLFSLLMVLHLEPLLDSYSISITHPSQFQFDAAPKDACPHLVRPPLYAKMPLPRKGDKTGRRQRGKGFFVGNFSLVGSMQLVSTATAAAVAARCEIKQSVATSHRSFVKSFPDDSSVSFVCVLCACA